MLLKVLYKPLANRFCYPSYAPSAPHRYCHTSSQELLKMPQAVFQTHNAPPKQGPPEATQHDNGQRKARYSCLTHFNSRGVLAYTLGRARVHPETQQCP